MVGVERIAHHAGDEVGEYRPPRLVGWYFVVEHVVLLIGWYGQEVSCSYVQRTTRPAPAEMFHVEHVSRETSYPQGSVHNCGTATYSYICRQTSPDWLYWWGYMLG